MLRKLLVLAALASIGTAVWLLAATLFTLPALGSTGQMSFWTPVMIAFFIFGGLTLYVIRFPDAVLALKIALGFCAAAGVFVGAAAILQNEFQGRTNGNWEGYISLLGGVLLAHGIIALAFLFKGFRRRSS